jgi:hypothetical protein
VSYAPQQRANVPSRTGPVILIVAGALAMILGPIIGIVMSVSNLFGAVDWQGFTDTQQITNGSTADLAANAEWMVVPSSGAQGYSCDVTGTNGEMWTRGAARESSPSPPRRQARTPSPVTPAVTRSS